MITYTFDFERYKQALRLNQLIKDLLSPSAVEPEISIESPQYNLIDNIIVVGDKQ